MEKTYRYSLQKYRSPADKHTCPSCGRRRCFKYYVDEDGQKLDERVGYCDHQASCGYHYTPKQFFADNPQRSEPMARNRPIAPPRPVPPLEPSFLDSTLVERSRASIYRQSDLITFLLTIFNTDTVNDLCDRYRMGMTRDRRTIFWQIDIGNRVRTGLIMKYRPDGHRDHDAPGAFNWAHAILAKRGEVRDFRLAQCLFGEHLLAEFPQRDVALVEGAKSALICAAWMPQYVWVATCGKNQFKADVLRVLRGRNVTVFPDVDGYDRWRAAAAELSARIGCASLRVSDLVQRLATPEQLAAHIDIADLVVEIRRREYVRTPEETAMLELLQNPEVAAFMRTFGLTIDYSALQPEGPEGPKGPALTAAEPTEAKG